MTVPWRHEECPCGAIRAAPATHAIAGSPPREWDRRQLQAVGKAVVIATGVTADSRREVLGFDVGDSEDGAFWAAFLRGQKARGLGGVQLLISDANTGLKQAIGSVLIGTSWQGAASTSCATCSPR